MFIGKYNTNSINTGGRRLTYGDTDSLITHIEFIPSLPMVSMACTTKEPHRLLPDDNVVIYFSSEYGTTRKVCTLTIPDETHFTMRCDFSIELPINQINEYDDETTQLVLSKRIKLLESKDEYEVYGGNNETPLFEGCASPLFRFATDRRPESIIEDEKRQGNQVILPTPYSESLKMQLLSRKCFVYDWRCFDFSDVTTGFIGDVIFVEERPYFDIPVLIEANNDYALRRDDVIFNHLVQDVAKVNLPGIVDMEKRAYVPYTPDGTRIKEIRFIPHFKNRGGDKWYVSNQVEQDWANKSEMSDTLVQMGFTVDDVRYQKKKLKKSFLRILYYDSKDVTTQSLLGYSTIFYDTGEAYTTYVKNIIEQSKSEDTIDPLKNIDGTFMVKDRYDYTRSSEGFYVYLFPYDLEELALKGDAENSGRTIYMKVEFNHAGVGKTIPFIIPVRNGRIPSISDSEFPQGYLTEENGVKSVDVQGYMTDMFLEMNIFFSPEHKQYEYYFPNIEPVEGVLTIPLVEPIVNR